MKKSDLIKRIINKTGVEAPHARIAVFDVDVRNNAKRYTASAVDIILDSIIDALGKGRNVEVRGFGSFTVKTYTALKQFRNPKTETMLPTTRPTYPRPWFKAGLELKKRLNHIAK